MSEAIKMGVRERVIFIHGTGATAPNEEGGAWWQTEGILWRTLLRDYKDALVPQAFTWSGENSEAARRAAGRALGKSLKAFHAGRERVHLIGHSHGGSVIWHALQELDHVPRLLAETVSSWATVGTPFLHYGARRPRLYAAVFSAVLCAVLLAWAAYTLAPAKVGFAWDEERWATALWFGLCIIPLIALVASTLAIIPYLRQWLRNSSRGPDLVGEAGAKRYLGIWSSQDEPTIGLGASGSFSLKLLREAGPDSKKAPVLERLRHPIAATINQFVNNLVSRAVQGSTLAHLELRATTSYPVKDIAQKSLPVEVDSLLIESANVNSAIFGRRIRELLVAGANAVSGFKDLQAAASKASTFKELVHTTYFDQAACVDLLLHHVVANSPTLSHVSATSRVNGFYETRFAPDTQVPRHDTLPSNRMGLFVSAFLVSLSAALVLVAFSQAALYTIAFAPTTPAYQVQKIAATTDHLAAALLPEPTRIKDAKDAELVNYVRNLVKAQQLPRLIEAAAGLPPGRLKEEFLRKAVPVILSAATHQQLEWLVSQSPDFLAYKAPEEDMVITNHFDPPNSGALIGRLAAGGHPFDRGTYDRILSSCKQDKTCRGSLQLQIVHALMRNGARKPPDYMLPLPPPSMPRMNSQTELSLVDRSTLSGEPGNEKFIAWAVANKLWAHSALFRTNSGFPRKWADYERSVFQALASESDEAVYDVLQLVVDTRWTTTVPAEAIRKLREAAARAKMPVYRDWRTTNAEQIQFWLDFIASDPVAVCNGPQDSGISRDPGPPVACVVRPNPPDSRLRLEALRILDVRNIKSALKAKHLSGPDGLLERLPGHLGVVHNPGLGASPLKYLVTQMQRDLCARLADRPLPEWTDSDQRNLAKFFSETGLATSPLPPPVEEWAQFSGDIKAACKVAGREPVSPTVIESARIYNLAIAEWLLPTHPERARQLALGMAPNYRLTLSTPSPFPEMDADWFLGRGFFLDAIEAAASDETKTALIRRTAYFRLATCLGVQGGAKAGKGVAALGEQTALVERKFGKPEELREAYAAEAFYYFSLGDWRRGTEVCSACDVQARLTLANSILPLLAQSEKAQFQEILSCRPPASNLAEFVKAKTRELNKASALPRISD